MTPILAIGLALPAFSWAQTDSADHYFQKGLEEKQLRHYLVASRHFEKALQFNPKFIDALVENAFVYLEMRKTDQAMQAFRQVLQFEPNHQTAARELLQLSYNYRQWAAVRELAAKCPQAPGADKYVGMSFYQEEDYGNALKKLLPYISKNPTDGEAMYTIARSYLDMEDYKTAVPYYQKAVALNEEKNAWAYELGMLFYTINDYKNAVVYFQKAADKGYNQHSSDFVENMGYALIYSGEFEKGERLIEGLIMKRPNDKTLLRDIADAYYKNKMYDKTLNYCQKLMEMDMNDGKALYMAGMCFQKKGDKTKGQGMCDKAIEMDPSLAHMRTKSMDMGL